MDCSLTILNARNHSFEIHLGYRAVNLCPFDTTFSSLDYPGVAKICPSSCTFLTLPTVSISKNMQLSTEHGLGWVEVWIRMPFRLHMLSRAVVSKLCSEEF